MIPFQIITLYLIPLYLHPKYTGKVDLEKLTPSRLFDQVPFPVSGPWGSQVGFGKVEPSHKGPTWKKISSPIVKRNLEKSFQPGKFDFEK